MLPTKVHNSPGRNVFPSDDLLQFGLLVGSINIFLVPEKPRAYLTWDSCETSWCLPVIISEEMVISQLLRPPPSVEDQEAEDGGDDQAHQQQLELPPGGDENLHSPVL